MLLMSLLVQVFIIAVFNFVIVYYVFTSVDRGDGGRFSPKLQSRLPKESVEVEVVGIQSQEEEQSDDGSLLPPSPSNSNSVVVVEGESELTLVNSMKNLLFGKAQEKNDTKENENDASSEGDSPTADDKELRARLQDSAEIELYPRDPSGLPAHPVLELESQKLASLVNKISNIIIFIKQKYSLISLEYLPFCRKILKL